MLEALVSDGTVALLALAVLGLEAMVLVALAPSRRTLVPLLANLFSGLFLILALRAALVGDGAGAVALFLGLGGAAHLADVLLRLRR
jgi:hypothetical protein